MHGWQSCTQRQGVDANPVGRREGVGTNIKCVRAALERLEGTRDILRFPDFEWEDFETERAGHRLNLAQLQHNEGISDIAHDRYAAETGNDLPQEFEPLAGEISRQGCKAGDVAARPRQADD